MEDFARAPASESFRLIDFTEARVITGIVPDRYILVVSGEKPYLNMEVSLSPRIYIRRPEYWGIEVVGSLPGIGLPTVAPYHVSLPLDGILGTKGIEVVGANRSETFDVPPESRGGQKEHATGYYRAVQVSGTVLLSAVGMAPSAGYRVFFEQSPIRIFPPEFNLFQEEVCPGADVLTPFCVLTSFQSSQAPPVERVVVHDGRGRHEVRVTQEGEEEPR
ncbi:MAG TPA: hypothetical protein VE685_13640 [Thermoanaerobaculia bacterium]|nr:hypothetical protein [Thermoanaerobaculia bacterium]